MKLIYVPVEVIKELNEFILKEELEDCDVSMMESGAFRFTDKIGTGIAWMWSKRYGKRTK